jgi:hypothetical protein
MIQILNEAAIQDFTPNYSETCFLGRPTDLQYIVVGVAIEDYVGYDEFLFLMGKDFFDHFEIALAKTQRFEPSRFSRKIEIRYKLVESLDPEEAFLFPADHHPELILSHGNPLG